MNDRTPNRFAPALAALVLGLFLILPAPTRADLIYHVDVDATAVASGTSGEIYFQFNPGGAFYQQATATVANVREQGIAFLGGTTMGDASQTAPLPGGTLSLDNGTITNDLLENVTFGAGSRLSFDVTLGGAAINAPDGNPNEFATTFFFGVLDADFNPLLPVGNGVDPLVQLEIAPGSGSVSVLDTPPVALVTRSVPEPGSLALLGIGATAFGAIVRRRRRGAAETA